MNNQKPKLEGVDYDRHLSKLLSTLHTYEDPITCRLVLYGYLSALEETHQIPAGWLIIYSSGRDFYEEMTKNMTKESKIVIAKGSKYVH